MGLFYLLFILGAFCLLLIVPLFLTLIKSNAVLPLSGIVLLYLIVMLLEMNHSFFSTMIVIGNSVPFMWIALISGSLIALGSYLSLAYTSMGLLGLVLVQGIVQLAYNNWKWPHVVCKEFGINIFVFLYLSFLGVFNRLKKIVAW